MMNRLTFRSLAPLTRPIPGRWMGSRAAASLALRDRAQHPRPMAPLTLSPSDYRRLATVLRTLARTGARPVMVRLGLLRGAAPGEIAEGAACEGLVAALEVARVVGVPDAKWSPGRSEGGGGGGGGVGSTRTTCAGAYAPAWPAARPPNGFSVSRRRCGPRAARRTTRRSPSSPAETWGWVHDRRSAVGAVGVKPVEDLDVLL